MEQERLGQRDPGGLRLGRVVTGEPCLQAVAVFARAYE
jgi:hypothetical protein